MSTTYSPWEQLPAPEPKTVEYELGHFYKNTAKYLVQDTVRVMNNGLNIDLDKVMDLEKVLAEQLLEVDKELKKSKIVQKYLTKRHGRKIKDYIADRKSKMRSSSHYLVDFKHSDMVHRSYFMEEYAKKQGWGSPKEKLPTGVGKWPVKLVRKYAKSNKVIAMLLDGTLPKNTSAIAVALKKLSEDKADIYNNKYLAQVENPEVPYPAFNPGSPLQKKELFDMLGIASEATSKDTGEPSWDREQVERVNRETDDEDIKHFTQCFIDHSFAAIVKNNFIEAFYTYTVEGRLYGQYKLLGAKTGRYTSSNP